MAANGISRMYWVKKMFNQNLLALVEPTDPITISDISEHDGGCPFSYPRNKSKNDTMLLTCRFQYLQ